MTNQTAANLIEMLAANADQERSKNFQRFFKTGPGQYGEGDVFLGLTVPMTRDVVNDFKHMSISELEKLSKSEFHEARLATMIIMTNQFRATSDEKLKEELFKLYVRLLENGRVNNWDLIDTSAPSVIGGWLLDRDRSVLYEWIRSDDLWFRRAAIVGCLQFIVHGQSEDIFKLSELVLNDKHDLIHKASGWMLREVGKRCSRQELVGFIDKNVKRMPRTMLRYAIEHFDEADRQEILKR
ncbi:MAG: hypothetical protein RL556_419 [Actinomycetota bacterium]|jgi:3-methyladenine DNA glycosylase AlkD